MQRTPNTTYVSVIGLTRSRRTQICRQFAQLERAKSRVPIYEFKKDGYCLFDLMDPELLLEIRTNFQYLKFSDMVILLCDESDDVKQKVEATQSMLDGLKISVKLNVLVINKSSRVSEERLRLYQDLEDADHVVIIGKRTSSIWDKVFEYHNKVDIYLRNGCLMV